MKGKINIWRLGLGLLLALALLAPVPGLAKDTGKDTHYAAMRAQMVKELNLPADKQKEFVAVGEKFDKTRKDIFQNIKKNEADLQKAVAAPKPDEAKIKELVATVTQDFDKVFQSFRDQRQEEMALLTPLQQGKYILALKKWHQGVHKMKGKAKKK